MCCLNVFCVVFGFAVVFCCSDILFVCELVILMCVMCECSVSLVYQCMRSVLCVLCFLMLVSCACCSVDVILGCSACCCVSGSSSRVICVMWCQLLGFCVCEVCLLLKQIHIALPMLLCGARCCVM